MDKEVDIGRVEGMSEYNQDTTYGLLKKLNNVI